MLFKKAKIRVEELTGALNAATIKAAELEKQYNAVEAIIQSMVEGVIAVDKDTKILSVNPSIEDIFGITGRQSEGKFFLETIPNNDIAGIIDEVLKTGRVISRELALVWPVQKNFQVNASPISEAVVVSGCSIVIHDITELRRLETMRRDFVANVSHELKTPLTSIKGFIETLLAGGLEDKKNSRDFLKIIQEQAGRLEALVNDLLELSRLESKEIKLEKEKVSLKDLTDSILTGLKAQADESSLEIKNDFAPDLFVSADKEKIRQVLVNLIDNAVKFNKKSGHVRIYSQPCEGAEKVIIEDSGIGIPAKDIPRIFERFYRVDKARSRQLGGTGLGLSIVKHIVESHAGSLGVESTEGLGSKFWFILPE